MKNSTVDAAEVEQFSRIASEWWNPRGKFKPLHDINPLRIEWIKGQIADSSSQFAASDLPTANSPLPTLKGLRLLDIGCGGGLICEPFARLGASVTGIDASEKNIAVAKLHAEQGGLDIDYRCTTAEELVSSLRGGGSDEAIQSVDKAGSPRFARDDGFDIVLALEIVEHVADVDLFVKSCAALVKPGGLIIMSTISRTFKSYAFAIIGAEYVLRLLPRGTHDWNKFLKPSELCRPLQQHGITITEMTGMVLDPLAWQWKLNAKDLDVNYLLAGRKS